MRLAGRIALVTGGAGGIGAECARVMAREGATVVVTDIEDAAGEEVAREVGGDYRRLDVTDLAAWEALVADIQARHGGIDVFVHCAGIEGNMGERGLATSPEGWRRVIDVNLTASFWGCKTVVPVMLEKGTGSVILLSSITSFMATASAVAYGVSKAGVQQLSRSIAMIGAEGGKRVRCNSVHPGVIRTRMTETILAAFSAGTGMPLDQAEKAFVSVVPFGEQGTPTDVANTVLFLASDESSYVTGSEFKVDAGWLVKNAG
ncbi:MAG: SDR family oxidoreductase [Sphingomonas sp.]